MIVIDALYSILKNGVGELMKSIETSDLVTVVIPTYNRSNIIRKCIDSVLNQTYTNLEVIVVDDASNDNTEEVVKNIIDPRVVYIRLPENTQGTKPRNVGIEYSSGSYIAFLDSDDTWLENKVEKQLAFIKANKKENVLCFTGILLSEQLNKNEVIKRSINNNESILEYIINVGWVQCSTFMCSSSEAKLAMFSETVKKHQDWEFCYRLYKNNVDFLYLEEALTEYNIDINNNQISSNKRIDLSIEWINSIKKDISLKLYYSFLVNYVVNHMLELNKNKEAWDIYKNAYVNKSISLLKFLKGLLKCKVINMRE